MSLLAWIERRAAVLAVVCGFGVFASALGGMATVDRELRAVAPLDTTEFVSVSDRESAAAGDCERERGRERGEPRAVDFAKEL